MDLQGRTVEQLLADLASPAQGIVDRQQLLAAGVSSQQIQDRIRRGALIPEFPGVYRVGHAAPSTDAHFLAAVRAGGPDAYLCGLAAAHTEWLVKGDAPTPEVLTRTERRIKGVLPHRYRSLDPRDVTVVRAIPITTVPRTLVDIAAVLAADALARACHEAGVRYGTTPKQVEAVLQRRPTSPGAAKLRAVMSGDVKVVLSQL